MSTPVDEGQRAQILLAVEQDVVEMNEGGMALEQGSGRRLAAEPLLQIVEAADLPVADDEQLAVEHAIEAERRR